LITEHIYAIIIFLKICWQPLCK